jgi:ectoine hydroxylase-related dioxygenase (phytanoyl-CoA dioxygenase family)
VLLKTNRCDLLLPLAQQPLKALSEVVVENKGVMGHVIEIMLGKQAVLYELSSLISDPGSQRQVVHPDTPYGGAGGAGQSEPVLFSAFVALQDVELDMGPTLFLPRTHTEAMHAQFIDQRAGKDELLRTVPVVCGLLPKGSATIFDSRLLHAGSANRSAAGRSRALFYFTFKNPKLANAGNPGSIRPELVNKLTLQDLRRELALLEEKGSSPMLSELAATLR